MRTGLAEKTQPQKVPVYKYPVCKELLPLPLSSQESPETPQS